MNDDARIAVVVGDPALARPGDRVLFAAAATSRPGHAVGCACCRPRGGVGMALGQIFLDQVRNPAQGFSRVLVADLDAATVAQAIDADVLARARYRFAGSA